MAQQQTELRGVKSLFDICIQFCKNNIPISPDLLRGLPLPLVEELAVCLSPHELLTLEDDLNNRDVTKKGWCHQCKLLNVYNIKYGEKCEKCFHCCEGFDIPLTHRDLCLAHTVRNKMYEDARKLTTHSERSIPSVHDLRMAEEVKKLSINLNTLLKLSPQLSNAFTTSLVVLKVTGCGQFDGSIRWLQALAELTYMGQLRSLQIFNVDKFGDIWLQVFYIISGLFGCRSCAQHFSAAIARAKVGSSATHDEEDWDEDGVESSQPKRKKISSHETPEGFVSCSGAASTSQAQDSSVSASHGNWRVDKLHDDLHQWCSLGLSKIFLSALQQVGYAGLPDEEDLKFDTACGSQDDGLKDKSKKRKRKREHVPFSDNDSLMMEALGLCNAQQKQETTEVHSSSENSIRFVEALSNFHMEEGHKRRGLEHFSVTWAQQMYEIENKEDVIPMDEALGCCLLGWSDLTSISLDSEVFKTDACDLGECLTKGLLRGISEGTVQSVSVCLPSQRPCWLWGVLQILSGIQQTGNTKRTQPMHLLKIDSTDGRDHSGLFALSNAWCRDVPTVRPSCCCSQKNDPCEFESGPKVDMGIGTSETRGSSFPGLEELYLKGMVSHQTGSFCRLGEFMRRNHALRHISVLNCSLDRASVGLLLTALCSGVHPSLTCVDLEGSLSNVTDTEWRKLCQLLLICPSLTRLGLAGCQLKQEHVTSDEFVNTVKSHHTRRELVLDISKNGLGDAVWEFMAKAVCPESSLKELHFMQTASTTESGVTLLRRIVQNHADHLPLLRACSWSRLYGVNTSDQLQSLLKQLCENVNTREWMEREFMAMM